MVVLLKDVEMLKTVKNPSNQKSILSRLNATRGYFTYTVTDVERIVKK